MHLEKCEKKNVLIAKISFESRLLILRGQKFSIEFKCLYSLTTDLRLRGIKRIEFRDLVFLIHNINFKFLATILS